MKIFFTFLFGVLLLSCQQEQNSEIRVFDSANIQEVKVSEVFDSLEAIYLEATPESMVGDVYQLVSCSDYYIIQNIKNVIYVFGKDGHFVSCSKTVTGHGKGELGAVLGCSYNEFSHQIEVLTPYSLNFYDAHFNFEKAVTLPTKAPSGENAPGAYFDMISDLSMNEHLLASVAGRSNSGHFYIFNSETGVIQKDFSFEKDIIAHLSNQTHIVLSNSDNLYVVPPYLTNKVYCLTDKENSFRSSIQLDFGERTITKEHVNRFSQATREERRRLASYIREGAFLYPISQTICNNYIFSYIRNGSNFNDWYFVVHNLLDGKGAKFRLIDGKKEDLFFEFTGYDNCLYVACPDNDCLDSFISAFNNAATFTQSGFCTDTVANYNVALLKYKVK